MTQTPSRSARLGIVILAAMLGLGGCASGDAGGSGNTSSSGSAGDAECQEISADTVLTETTLERHDEGMFSQRTTFFSDGDRVVKEVRVLTRPYVEGETAESARAIYGEGAGGSEDSPVTVTMDYRETEYETTITMDHTKGGCVFVSLSEAVDGEKEQGLVEVK